MYEKFQVEIDKECPIPLYYQIKQNIKEAVDNNIFKKGDTIPSERELCELFNVSRTTIRQAINELVNEGVLEKIKGKGTFVANPKFNYGSIQDIVTYYDRLISRGYSPETEIIEQEVIKSTRKISEKLQIDRDDRIIRIKRLRKIDGEPIVIITNHVPYSLCPGLEEKELTDRSLYRVIARNYGFQVSRSEVVFFPGLADKMDAELLNQEKGDPLQIIQTVSLTGDGVAYDYFESRFRGNYGRIFTVVER